MIPIVMTASAFESNELACLQRAFELTQSNALSSTGVLLDLHFLKKYSHSSFETISVSSINLSDWMDSTQQPQRVTMRLKASKLNKHHMILLDARHHDTHFVTAVLHEVARIWFHLPAWQPAFILVIDDYHAVQFVRVLSETFYIQPLSTSKHTLQPDVRYLHRLIRSYRWLGFGRLSKLFQLAFTFLQKLKHYVHKKLT